MNQQEAQELVNTAKSDKRIARMQGETARGAEGFFQSLMYVEAGGLTKSTSELIGYARVYLANTASAWGLPSYRDGAAMALKVVAELSGCDVTQIPQPEWPQS